MDSERMFLADDGFTVDFRELSEDDLKTAEHFIEITRHLQEAHHLFLIFEKDIESLQKEYVLKNSGKVFCGQISANSEADYISVNSYIVNIISAGRTLVESMECYIENNYNIDDNAKKEYMDFYHNIYDTSFAYRLLIRLRDYSQHGHLPVSSMGNKYYFDLIQIANKPHYNHNKTMKNQMKNISDEILTKYHDVPTVSLTETLAEFVAKLLSVYKMFWYQTETELTQAYSEFQKTVLSYSDNVIKDENNQSEFFIYSIVDGNAHIVDPNFNPQEMFENFKKEAEASCDKYEKAYKELMGGNLFVQYSDGQISIETGTSFADNSLKAVQTAKTEN